VGSYPTVSPLPDAQGVLILESEESGGLLSVALSVGLPRPAVSWHPALWSPDFPQALGSARDRAPRDGGKQKERKGKEERESENG
jgi:hypothetical protein